MSKQINKKENGRSHSIDILQKRTLELNERIKELNCLYNISRISQKTSISLGEFIQEAIKIIPAGWQYPEITVVRVKMDDLIFQSDNFRETEWVQSTDIIVFGKNRARIEIYYLIQCPDLDEGPFLKEERNLINAIAEQFGLIIERKEAESKLVESLKEKEILLKEIHHRVKNNLQILSAIILLHTQSVQDAEMHEFLVNFQNRIKAMSQIHEELYRANNLEHIRLADYIQSLVTNLTSSSQLKAHPIKIIQDIDPIELDLSRAVHYGLIINELVTNAVKYAFNQHPNPELRIIIKKENQKTIKLTVTDNGKGFPAGFNIKNLKSLGMKIIQTSTKQLKGTITITNDPGAKIEIDFPFNID
jgi:two-component sensor histidine kinase